MNKQNMSEHMHQRTGDYIFLQQETSQLWTELIDYGCVIVYCVSVRIVDQVWDETDRSELVSHFRWSPCKT